MIFRSIINFFLFQIVIYLIPICYSYSQSIKNDSIIYIDKILNYPDSLIILPDLPVISNSEIIMLDSNYILKIGQDYTFDYSKGQILIHYLQKKPMKMNITYKTKPFLKEKIYFHQIPVMDSNKSILSKNLSGISFPSITPSEVFGKNIRKSGSLIRGFSLGSNKDLTLNSGLRLNLSGMLSKDLEINASLTDEKIPLLPEGNTINIKEFDKIFIDIMHPNFKITLGDFILENNEGTLTKFSRKLQGGKFSYFYEDLTATVTYTSSRGKFTKNEVLGSEGIQGPYKLKSPDGNGNILIVPGSETVFLNGKKLKRGEDEDYVIDYSSAEVTFTIKNVVKNNSRVQIEFEYNDRKFDRTFWGFNFEKRNKNKNFSAGISFYQENDSKESPLNYDLNDENKRILENSGSDQLNAYRNSITLTGIDSTGRGKGQYRKIDTVMNNSNYSYYIFDPGNFQSVYNISFSFVGTLKGDYERDISGFYHWVGIKAGGYLPVQILDLPEKQQSFTGFLNYSPMSSLEINSEASLSSFDPNTFSTQSGILKNGYAYNLKIKYKDSLNIVNSSLGIFEAAFYNNYISEKFKSLQRPEETEYNRNWNINDSLSMGRNIIGFETKYMPIKDISFEYLFGNNKYGMNNNTNRNKILLSIRDSIIPKVYVDYQETHNENPSYKNYLTILNSLIEYKLFNTELKISFMNEEKTDRLSNSDSLFNGYRLNGFSSEISPNWLKDLKIQYGIEFRTDEGILNGNFQEQSRRIEHKINFDYKLSGFSFYSSIGYQDIRYTDFYKNLGNKDINSLLVKGLSRINLFNSALDLNMYYETSRQNSAVTQKLYLRVEKGKGNYQYSGDLNKNGIADEYEFIQVRYDGDYIPVLLKTDKYVPVTDLKTSFRFRFTPIRFFQRPEGIFENVLSSFSTDTYIQLNENSNDENQRNIYFLNLCKFQNEINTLHGNINFTQDLFLFEKSEFINLRLRYLEKKNMNQYSFGYEKKHTIEQSSRLRINFFNDITNETNISRIREFTKSPSVGNRNFEIAGNLFSTNFSHRPFQELELAFQLEFSNKNEGIQNTTAAKNSQQIRANYSLNNKGSFRLEFERTEILLTNSINYEVYTLTDGLNSGKTWITRLNFDYQVNSFIQATLFYFGRTSGEGKLIHNGSMEIKLIF